MASQDDSRQLQACLPGLRRYARALAGALHADDLVQDTVERAWRKLNQRGGEMRPWLFSIMHNLHVDQLRRPGLALRELDDDALLAAPEHTPGQSIAIGEMDAALARLPLGQREVILLVALEQMPYEQVAATLGIPVGTVMSRLSRGRDRLRELLDGRPAGSHGAPTLKVVK
ncbi:MULTISPECIES: RNA polymerase sigma factor [unclassified Janthinobacterium]|jgi:RNA polymerase sigma-70 factor (ECF subfamily)|uniref:RNA polymerase sigma factor n=1 Tax=unclassified Janthinobacterium TaxID=2610881 RepID=UPI001E521FFB|nr:MULTISPECIES: RNA polymerase sigma factor [unclassified Janthinobacterium]MCC7643619.1 RNA polymerase sigma factor [Janthinobacterium sp. EB271-G4-3-1]MCC7691413.1 RNA polymerase sigma factor [Janthinobacterium sp. EB271-G4-3-2]